MHNKVYFTNKPGVHKKDTRFKLKTNFVAHIQYKEVNAFGWKVRDRISEIIEENINISSGQNLSNKEKTALRNLIKAKNNNIIFNDTDKNMGMYSGRRQKGCYIRMH